jgi:protein-S-isoprenylcysteine O-methyltransferase Ste14
MTLNVSFAIGCMWESLGIVWLVGLAFTKRTARSQSGGTRLFQSAVALLGFSLLGSSWFSQGWLGARFLPQDNAAQIAGLAVTAAGCLFAIWARLTLGTNWSGRATVKKGHELIVTGPYRLARHPIYTGLLLASLGTAMAIGEWRCALGMVIILLALIVKIGQEERLMMETFPKTYPQYRQRVKALIPGLL